MVPRNATYDAGDGTPSSSCPLPRRATGIGRFSLGAKIRDPFAEPELLTVAAAFEPLSAIESAATIVDGEGDRTAGGGSEGADRIADDDTWSTFSAKLLSSMSSRSWAGRLTALFEFRRRRRRWRAPRRPIARGRAL